MEAFFASMSRVCEYILRIILNNWPHILSPLKVISLEHAPANTWCRVAAQCVVPSRMMALGFLPHEQVRVVRRSQFKGGPLVVQVGNAVFALRADEASQVQVEGAS